MPYVAAAAAVGGALISANSASSAANKQAAGTKAAIDTTKEEFNSSQNALAPYRDAGTAALDRLSTLLGMKAPTMSVSDVAAQIRANFPNIQGDAEKTNSTSDADLVNGFVHAIPSALLNPASGTPEQMDKMRTLLASAQQATSPGAQPGAQTSPDSGSLLAKFTPEDLKADTVYNSGLQFGLDEGTKAIDRRAAATGGYDSGASEKALVRFASDYGSTKAGDAYTRFTNDQDRTFGKLTGIAGLGSGETNVGVNAGATNAGTTAGLITGGANAGAAASIAGGNAVAGGLNSIGQYQLLSQLSGGGQRTATTPGYDPNFTGDASASLVGSG